MLVFGKNHNRFVNWELLAVDAQNLALAPFSWFTVGELQYMAKYFSDMTQLLLLGKVEYGGGPIFKVVLEC